MRQKLLIVNPNLENHRDQDFETSIAIAEAARRAGLQPSLGMHVNGQEDQLPTWLKAHATFRPYSEISRTVSEPLDSGEPEIDCSSTTAPQTPLIARFGHDGLRACSKASWCIERGVYYLLPPFIHDCVKRFCSAAVQLTIPRIMRRKHRERAVCRLRHILNRLRYDVVPTTADLSALGSETARSVKHPVEGPFTSAVLNALLPHGLENELERALLFKRDVERTLALADLGQGDHVLISEAQAPERFAVQLIAMQLAPARRPGFHLVFRQSIFEDDATPQERERSPEVIRQRAFSANRESYEACEAVKLYADTEELARDYSRTCGLAVGVLPMPVCSEPESETLGATHAIQLAFLGEARDEKGFHWMPELLERLMERYVQPGRVRFLVQANVSDSRSNPLSVAAIEKLRSHSPHHVELHGLDSALSSNEYHRLLSRADVVLLPYTKSRSRACSSRILAEAIASGRPAVTPSSSWMSSQIPLGVGETFYDFESFVGAVTRVIEHYGSYRKGAEAYRADWLSRNSSDRLIAVLAGLPRVEPARLRLAA